ncbi:MAG: hypothetical protein KatS3mg108_1290 [Isosphaeraceae bacterium]|jgi:hypothetical protein|nr:MAG: hypothetical protein KatS3mg108_1290 [Isosphaeraceae bacterium]
MRPFRFGGTSLLALAVGLASGWVVATTAPLRASAADRNGASVVQTGVVTEIRDRQGKTLATRDGLYILNYSNGLLLAAVPDFQQVGSTTRVLSDFAERDLVRDFGLPPGANPRFLMTTLRMGLANDDWSPLVVLELDSGQVACYRLLPQATSGSTRPNFQLIERRTDPRLARSLASAIEPADPR